LRWSRTGKMLAFMSCPRRYKQTFVVKVPIESTEQLIDGIFV
jgi:hypothetical protein